MVRKRMTLSRDLHAKIPADIMDKADEHVQEGRYQTRTEFVSDAMRRRDEELRKELKEEKESRDNDD